MTTASFSEQQTSDCTICAQPIDGVTRLFTYTSCDHSSVCSICSLRMRALQRNFACPSCKTVTEKTICSSKQDLKYDQFEIWGENINGGGYTYDERGQIFFPNDYYKSSVQTLWLQKCNICHHTKRDMKGLKTHVKLEHSIDLCNLCIENRYCFPCEVKYYTTKQYETHLRCGDGDGSTGHPACEFCRKRYFDRTALFTHLTQDHFSCHICQKQGIFYRYYQDYNNLENHFRSDHFICEDNSCLEKKFVVFMNSIDLAAHQRQWHPLGTSQKQRVIPMHFKYRRGEDEDKKKNNNNNNSNHDDHNNNSNENTETVGNSAGIGGRVNNGEWQVELANIAVDPRDPSRSTGAAAAAEEYQSTTATSSTSQTNNEEDFPALPSDFRNSNRPLWSAHRVTTIANNSNKSGKSKEEEFPALLSKPIAKSASSSSLKSSLLNSRSNNNSNSNISSLEDFPAMPSKRTINFKNVVQDNATTTTTNPSLTAFTVSNSNSSGVNTAVEVVMEKPASYDNTEAYPDLHKPTNNSNNNNKQKKNNSNNSKSANGSWGTALNAVGMSSAVSVPAAVKSQPISVAKLPKNNSNRSASSTTATTTATRPSLDNAKVLKKDANEVYAPPPRAQPPPSTTTSTSSKSNGTRKATTTTTTTVRDLIAPDPSSIDLRSLSAAIKQQK